MSKFRFKEDPWILDELEQLRKKNNQLYRRVCKNLALLEKRGMQAIKDRFRRCKPHISVLEKTEGGTEIYYVKTPPNGDNIYRTFFYMVRSREFGDYPKYLDAFQKKTQKIPVHIKDRIVNRYYQRERQGD